MWYHTRIKITEHYLNTILVNPSRECLKNIIFPFFILALQLGLIDSII